MRHLQSAHVLPVIFSTFSGTLKRSGKLSIASTTTHRVSSTNSERASVMHRATSFGSVAVSRVAPLDLFDRHLNQLGQDRSIQIRKALQIETPLAHLRGIRHKGVGSHLS